MKHVSFSKHVSFMYFKIITEICMSFNQKCDLCLFLFASEIYRNVHSTFLRAPYKTVERKKLVENLYTTSLYRTVMFHKNAA